MPLKTGFSCVLMAPVNCCALSEELFESELFGHERGSFTGAIKTHKGRFERADKGTLFLDEIGDMPARTQAKLLRVLEEGTIERVGGEEEYPVDVRIIASTNVFLEQAVAMGRFRADLYHRLAVFRVHVPSLRERAGDIAILVNHFLKMMNQRYNRQVVRLTPEALKLLEEYHWPGNIRELRNVLERVYVESAGKVIGHNAFNEWVQERDYFAAGEWNLYQWENQKASKSPIIMPHYPSGLRLPRPSREIDQFPDRVALLPFHADTPRLGDEHWRPHQTGAPGSSGSNNSGQLPGRKDAPVIDVFYTKSPVSSSRPKELTRELITRAFQSADGNITQAARFLGIHKATLYRHMKNMGLTREMLNHQSPQNIVP